MIYEKFEPKNYAKARMKNARLGAALVREAPKPQRPLPARTGAFTTKLSTADLAWCDKSPGRPLADPPSRQCTSLRLKWMFVQTKSRLSLV